MAGLLDFLLNGQGGGVLPPFAQNFGAGDPGNAPAPDASQAYAQAAPQQVAQAAPQYAQPQMPQTPQMGPPRLSGLAALFAGMNPQAGQAYYQRLMMQQQYAAMTAPKSAGGLGLSPAQALAGLQNPELMKFYGGIPINNGIAELPNKSKIPVISTPGHLGQYAMPQDQALRSMVTNTPVEMSPTTTKVGDISTTGPTLYQNGSIGAPTAVLPGTTPAQPPTGQVSGLQGAIDLNNKLAQGKAAAEAEGKAQGTNAATLTNTTGIADQFLKQIDDVRNDPNLSYAIGPIAGRLEALGGPQADLVNKITQLQSQTMLQGFQQLRGAGRITQAEMFKAGEALGRLNRVSSLQGFKSALDDLRSVVVAARTRAGIAAGQGPTPPAQQEQQPQAQSQPSFKLPPGWTVQVR